MLYNFIITLYSFAIRIASFFCEKPGKMVQGYKNTYKLLSQCVDSKNRYIWFHAASLGEFEQGRPLLESIRRKYPQYKILQTFFSPSGYEVRKDYEGADLVCYLPIDTLKNARKFLNLIRPEMAFFIKYEFWKNYLFLLHEYGIPVYSVSSIFRQEQIFFRWYGKEYAKVLEYFSHFFVQNEQSRQLLEKLGHQNVSVIGDTRFDRVIDIKCRAKELPIVDAFKNEQMTLVVGSSWEADEEIVIDYVNRHSELKLIIAPHVVNKEHVESIIAKLNRSYVLYTEAQEGNVGKADCLIMNCYGVLSSIYRYGEIAYIGGGFGEGVHNVLEAAVYGVPVIIGPNNHRFQEIQDLLGLKGAFQITDPASFNLLMDRLVSDEQLLKKSSSIAGTYVSGHAGATRQIQDYLHLKNCLN